MRAIGPITVEQVRRTVKALELSKLLSRQDLDFLYSGTVHTPPATISEPVIPEPK